MGEEKARTAGADGPQDRAIYLLYGVEQMVVIVPINADIDKAEYVANKYRDQGIQGSKLIAMRHLHFQYHDGNDDGNYTIAERFQSIFPHQRLPLGPCLSAKLFLQFG
jgi:hypothetical protein